MNVMIYHNNQLFRYRVMKQKIEQAAKILNKTGRPSLPYEVTQLQESLNVKYPNTVEIASIINKNPELLSLFLKVANTSTTSRCEEIKSAKQAIDQLGLEKTGEIFMASSVLTILTENQLEADYLEFSLKIGLAAAEMSHWVYDISRSEAYITGILSDVGGLFMNKYDKNYIVSTYRTRLLYPNSKAKEELAKHQTTHEYLSALLSKEWGAKPIVYKSILAQQMPDLIGLEDNDPKTMKMAAILKTAIYAVIVAEDESYITEELKEDRRMAMKTVPEVPSEAIKSMIDAVKAYGNKIKLTYNKVKSGNANINEEVEPMSFIAKAY